MGKRNFHFSTILKRNWRFSETEKAIFWNGKSVPLIMLHTCMPHNLCKRHAPPWSIHVCVQHVRSVHAQYMNVSMYCIQYMYCFFSCYIMYICTVHATVLCTVYVYSCTLYVSTWLRYRYWRKCLYVKMVYWVIM